MVMFPELVFTDFPFALTMEGQYIVKNAVLISAGLVIGATVRGGQWVARDAVPAANASPAETG